MIHKILQLHGWAAYAVIFALPALEASVFLGFLFPGEIAVLLGGVLAFQRRISLGGAIAAAIAGAIIGDSVGYAVGRRYGYRLLEGRLGRLIKLEHRERALAFLRRHGGKAVLLGRFTAALRVLVPGLAGMAEIHYPTFLLFNVIGGVLWAGAFTLIGYAAGNGYRRVEHVMGRASLALLGLVVFVGIVALVARSIAKNPERFRAGLRRVGSNRVVHVVTRPLAFFAARLKPGSAFGLELTIGALSVLAFGAAFGYVVRAVVGSQTLHFVDLPVFHWLTSHTASDFTIFMKVVTQLGAIPLDIVAGALVAIPLVRRKAWQSVVILAATPIGAGLIELIVKQVVRRPRPPGHALAAASGYSFPSGHATRAFALSFAIALVASRLTHSWPWKVTLWSAAVVVSAAVGFSRLYLRVHWLTDVAAAYALGALWFALVTTFVGAWTRARHARAPATP